MSEEVDKNEILEVPTASAVSNPFPGLRPFRTEESHLFFGREGQSDEVLLKLSKNRFVGVIGPSGSGKSSFIYCGVLPILYGGFLTNESPNWEVIVTRPGAGPIDNLSEAILEKDPNYWVEDQSEKKIKRTITTTLLRSSSLGLVEAVMQSRKSKDKNYLILVDQFEELFRFKDGSDTRTVNETLAFVNLLVEASNYADAPIYVAITMRSDFIGDCAQFPDLTKKINDSHYLVPQMTRDQKRKAITGPIAVGGANISQRLTQQVLNDLGDGLDQLPILQHALMRTWGYWSKYREHNLEEVDIKHYEAIGTMSEALSLHANEAYDELDEEQKRICESLFKAITEKRGENFGIRRPTRLDEIAEITGVTQQEVIKVIEHFRQPGRSLLTPAHPLPLDEKSIIDISHESLMRIWTRLKNWVDDEAEAVQMYLRLSEAAAMYQVGKAGLWRPPDLQLALNWEKKHKPTLVWGQRYHPAYERTMVFLDYSRKEFETEQRIKELQQKRRLRNARIIALVMAFFTILAIGFLVFALNKRTEAIKNLAEAETQRAIAQRNEQRSDSLKGVADYEKGIAEQRRHESDSLSKVAIKEKGIAENQRAIAKRQEQAAKDSARAAQVARGIALVNARLANTEKDRANDERDRANDERAKADRLRYLAIAKSLAIKSTLFRKEQGPEQVVLKSLLAQQAYNYNKEYQGEEYDSDVYYGLYEALSANNDPITTSLKGHRKGIRALASNETGNRVYSAGTLGKILRWSVSNEVRTADTLAQERPGYLFRAIAVNNNDQKLAVGGELPKDKNNQSFIEVYDLNTGESTQVRGIERDVWEMVFTPDGNQLYILDNGGLSVKISDLQGMNQIISSDIPIKDITLSSDGKWLLGVTNDGKVMTYDVQNSYNPSVIYDNKSPLLAIDISKEGSIAIGDIKGGVKEFELFGTQGARSLIGHTSQIDDIKFSPDGRFIATASKDRTVRLWNRQKLNAQPIILRDHPTWVWKIAFSPDSRQILAGTREEIVRSWVTNVEAMADRICSEINRNMTQEEWNIHVSDEIDLGRTCENIDNAND